MAFKENVKICSTCESLSRTGDIQLRKSGHNIKAGMGGSRTGLSGGRSVLYCLFHVRRLKLLFAIRNIAVWGAIAPGPL